VAAIYRQEASAALTLTGRLSALPAPATDATPIGIWLAERRQAAMTLGKAAGAVATGRFSGGLIGQSDLAAGASQRSALVLGITACATLATGAVPAPAMLSGPKVTYLTMANAICLSSQLLGLQAPADTDLRAIDDLKAGGQLRQAASRARVERDARGIEQAGAEIMAACEFRSQPHAPVQTKAHGPASVRRRVTAAHIGQDSATTRSLATRLVRLAAGIAPLAESGLAI
jgi:hypothetical protein